jgi:glycine cleavage system transcriptional repressor
MQSFILTAFGSDQPGLVSSLTGLIQENGGNIEESRMIKMGNQFVMTVLITLTEDEVNNLKSNLPLLSSLHVQIHPTQKTDFSNSNTKIIELSGADNEGIVYSLTKKLAMNNINIIELETFIDIAPISATPLFNLKATIDLPSNLTIDSLHDILENHSSKLGVNIEIIN